MFDILKEQNKLNMNTNQYTHGKKLSYVISIGDDRYLIDNEYLEGDRYVGFGEHESGPI